MDSAGRSLSLVLALVLTCLGSGVRGQSQLCQTDTMQVDGSPCTQDKDRCEFLLEIKYKHTMTLDDGDRLFANSHKLYRYNDTSARTPISEDVLRQSVVVGDGWTPARLVTVVNGTMPGPCLALYKDQTVIVHVVNDLPSESLTIHWHGLHMTNNAYMDGVAFVTQCPILPGQSFTYKFKAETTGTYWYHSHIGAQRSMGILGPLIVREKNAMSQPEERVLVLQDWNHDVTSDQMELGFFSGTGNQQIKASVTHSLDGGTFSPFVFQSGLINGRGRYYDHNMQLPATATPLEVIEVERNRTYRFRVIAAGNLHPFRVAAEGHKISVVASDGWDFEPVPAESFVINPGERYDFILTTNMTTKDYLIYAETLEVDIKPPRHVAEAILRYNGSSSTTEPPSLPTGRGCTASNKCVVVNCPYQYYPENQYTECILLDQLNTGTGGTPAPTVDNPKDLKEMFLNFAFPGPGESRRSLSSVNGIKFHKPPVAAILQPKNLPSPVVCGPECGAAQQQCKCAHTQTLERNRVHQIVLTNMGDGKGFSHPVHIHGYSFYVVKVGYPVYNNKTGSFSEENLDVDCQGPASRNVTFCNTPRWQSASWRAVEGGEVPGLNLHNPIRKDTIIVPTGGYVVLRIKADNPGMWFVHCHIEMHHLSGMALMLDGTSPSLDGPPPGFPTCNNYYTSAAVDTSAAVTRVADPTLVVLLLAVSCLLSTLAARQTGLLG